MNLRVFFGSDSVASISGSRESWEYGTVTYPISDSNDECGFYLMRTTHFYTGDDFWVRDKLVCMLSILCS